MERATTERERERWGGCLCTDRKGRGLSSGIPELVIQILHPVSIFFPALFWIREIEDKYEDQQFLQITDELQQQKWTGVRI